MWKKTILFTLLVSLLIGTAVVIYCLNLSVQIEKRFSGRRWSIPSKIYSDITVLYPGQKMDRSLFLGKLHSLGYRRVERNPAVKGEFKVHASSIDLFLHDLQSPLQQRQGFRVRIRFGETGIQSIIRTAGGQVLPLLELEPEEIMLFFGRERESRQLVSIDKVPVHLIHGVLAIEDARFYQHRGVDPAGILRALYINLRYGEIKQGGSTITQQLAKNYFLSPERTLSRKIKELLISLTIEFMYEKDEIFEIYLNEIYMGQKGSVSINGMGEASRFYFDKPVTDLSLSECATLAGLIRGPNYYSPYHDRERCRKRRNSVLHAMHRRGWLTREKLEAAVSLPVRTAEYMTYTKKSPYFLDYVSQQLEALYSPEALTSLGLSIYTTLDTQVQAAAEKALQKGLDRLEKAYPRLSRDQPDKRLQGVIVVMQPKTGNIVAMVGGRDYGMSQFNRATQARRQPGSAFKPFVFLSGLDDFSPSSRISNKPKSYSIQGQTWTPRNYEPAYGGEVTLREALAQSINVATVDLAMKVGLERIVKQASELGFSTPIKPYPSAALGSFEVVPLDLARAYCAFAADGMLPYPLSLKHVVDEEGKFLQRRHTTIRRVASPAEAYIMSSMLKSAVTQGTAKSLKAMGISFPLAGKTGTTNDFRDGWFVGYTPDILALVWVGFDNGESIKVPGAKAAMPIWADLMRSIPWYISGEWFTMPPGVVKRTICRRSGKLAVPGACPEQVEEIFTAENAPTDFCPLHYREEPFNKIIKGIKNFFRNF